LDDSHYYKEPANDLLPRYATGRITVAGGYILYVYTAVFSVYKARVEYNIPDVSNVIDTFIADLKDSNNEGLKGVIFDFRGCIGGDGRDWSYILGRLINEPLKIFYTRAKSGEGRLDYGPWIPVWITPAPNAEKIKSEKIGNIPIIALTDGLTTSAAEMAAIGIQAMPNGTILGAKTGGVLSMPQANPKYNAGIFTSGPFYTTVVLASMQTKHLDGNIYEGIGVEPDEHVPQNWQQFLNKEDNVLEAAIKKVDNTWARPF
jgi:C-terminal processing protease CtpA/Prc